MYILISALKRNNLVTVCYKQFILWNVSQFFNLFNDKKSAIVHCLLWNITAFQSCNILKELNVLKIGERYG